MQVELKVRGFEELYSKLQSLRLAVREEILKKALKAGGLAIERAAKAGAPQETGVLQGSIRTVIESTSDVNSAVAKVGPSSKGFYGRFLEDGTQKMKARPWLKPAFERSMEAAEDEMVKVLNDEIEKAIRG